jgi:hypothetical protein
MFVLAKSGAKGKEGLRDVRGGANGAERAVRFRLLLSRRFAILFL